MMYIILYKILKTRTGFYTFYTWTEKPKIILKYSQCLFGLCMWFITLYSTSAWITICKIPMEVWSTCYLEIISLSEQQELERCSNFINHSQYFINTTFHFSRKCLRPPNKQKRLLGFNQLTLIFIFHSCLHLSWRFLVPGDPSSRLRCSKRCRFLCFFLLNLFFLL